LKWVVSDDVATAERAAARYIAMRLRDAVQERGRATFAISGGRSPWGLFGGLASQDVEWHAVHLFQVDERIAPQAPEARNWLRFLANPLAQRIPEAHRHAMPIAIEDAQRAAREYEVELTSGTGDPPTIDVVHLGLGADGHTASLFAGDPLSEESARWVGVSRVHDGYRRLTLTFPTLNRARCIVWFVVGTERRDAMRRLRAGDASIPASRVQRERATGFADSQAAPDD
jgi:6-phosphogluconolactonase